MMMKTKKMRGDKETPPLPPAGEGWGEGGWKTMRHDSTARAQNLRQNQTEAEKIIWHALKAKRFEGYKFRRQFLINPYIVDFACTEKMLVMEIDGGQHCENRQDEVRTKVLEAQGWQVIRFWNNDVMGNLDGVLSTLSLNLSRRAGEGTIAAQDDEVRITKNG
jgi:very-short-patch-repair endonuclease